MSEFRTFKPNPDNAKTAVLCTPVTFPVVIEATWGPQTLNTPFYLVAEGDGSYGAAQFEFEHKHVCVGPNRWVADLSVQARPAVPGEIVNTVTTSGGAEATAVAVEGDWVVRQPTGEEQIVRGDVFARSYIPAGPTLTELESASFRSLDPAKRGW